MKIVATALCISLLSLSAQTYSGLKPPVFYGELGPGVVVEKVERSSAADRARLKEGDIVLSWVSGDSKGPIESPFDLLRVETEQAPFGQIILEGLRNTEKWSWTLEAGFWHLEVRPNLQGSLLAQFEAGQELVRVHQMNQAARRWLEAATQVQETQVTWLASWLFLHIAEALDRERRWKESDRAFQEALAKAPGNAAAVSIQLLETWAHILAKRRDWITSEKYYQRALLESRKANGESLATVTILQRLGNVAWMHQDMGISEEYFRQALVIQEKLPTGAAMAATLTALAEIATFRGRLEEAEAYARRALAIGEKSSPPNLRMADNLDQLGEIFFRRGDLDQATSDFRQALEIREKIKPGDLSISQSYSSLGEIAFQTGELDKAEDYFQRALTLREKLGPDASWAAMSLRDLGNVALQRGNLAKAEEYHRRVLAIREHLSPGDFTVANTFHDLGNVIFLQGDLVRAEDYQRRALALWNKLLPNSLYVAQGYSALGNIAQAAGDLVKAEDYYQQAETLWQKLVPDSPYVALGLSHLGLVFRKRDNPVKAAEYQRQALTILEKSGLEPPLVAFILEELAHATQDQGNPVKAEEYYRQALAIKERVAPGTMDHADILGALAGAVQAQGRVDAAAEIYEQALNALEHQTTQLGGTEMIRSGFRAKHSNYYKDYIALLVSLKRPDPAFHILERWHARTLLEMMAASHLDVHKDVDSVLLDQERSLKGLLQARIDQRIRLFTNHQSHKLIQSLDSEIAGLLRQQQDVEAHIRANSPAYAALTQPQSMSAKQVEQLLDEDTLLLEYSLGEERSYVFAVTSASVEVYELPRRAEIETMARQIYQVWTEQNRIFPRESALRHQARLRKENRDSASLLAKLSRVILGPVAIQLKGKRLLIVSDGALQYIPFAALPIPDSLDTARLQDNVPLVMEHEIVNLPSASLLATLRQEAAMRKKAPKAVAVLADPVFAKDDVRVVAGVASRQRPQAILIAKRNANNEKLPGETTAADSARQLTRSAADLGLLRQGQPYLPRLPFSRREAQAILSVTPKGQAMEALDFRASRATAVSPDLSQYRVVHFATHGLLNSEHPELSGLVFSLVDSQGRPQGGFLGLEDVYNLNLHADLVVLSACETALGKDVQGEGLIGLTRGFMYAGASQVVASLWSVDDAATAELMRLFYQAMEQEGLRPAAALRRAQMEIRKQERWRQPYYWAGFVIQGEQ